LQANWGLAVAIPVTPQSMNYASAVFAGFAAIATAWYAVNARKYYKGPSLSAVRVAGA
jgi:hypothetical protein